jgi:hypothetical protein
MGTSSAIGTRFHPASNPTRCGTEDSGKVTPLGQPDLGIGHRNAGTCQARTVDDRATAEDCVLWAMIQDCERNGLLRIHGAIANADPAVRVPRSMRFAAIGEDRVPNQFMWKTPVLIMGHGSGMNNLQNVGELTELCHWNEVNRYSRIALLREVRSLEGPSSIARG